MIIKKTKKPLELQKLNVLRGVLIQKGNKERINSYILKIFKDLKREKKKKPLEVINQAIDQSSPIFTFRRVVKSGRLYEIPVPISPNRAAFMSTLWLRKVAQKRSAEGSHMHKFLAPELLNIQKKRGGVLEQLNIYTADGLEKNIFKKMIRKKRSAFSRSKGINAHRSLLSKINRRLRSRKYRGKTREMIFTLRRLKKRHLGRNKKFLKKTLYFKKFFKNKFDKLKKSLTKSKKKK